MNSCSKVWCGFFKAIHDHHRQHILEIIHHSGPLNASEIIGKLKLSQPTVSHHLKILSQAKLIHAKKKGKETVYTINKSEISQCCGSFMEKYTSE